MQDLPRQGSVAYPPGGDGVDGNGDDGGDYDDDGDDDYGDDDSKSPGGITFGDFMDFLSVLSKGSQRDKVRHLIGDNYLCFTNKSFYMVFK